MAIRERLVRDHPTVTQFQNALRNHLLKLATVYYALNQTAEAVWTKEELVALAKKNPSDLYGAACGLALSVPLVQGGQQQALAADAVQTLKQAVAAGWSDAQKTGQGPDLAPLRDRNDFRRLLAELFDRSFPANPLAP